MFLLSLYSTARKPKFKIQGTKLKISYKINVQFMFTSIIKHVSMQIIKDNKSPVLIIQTH